MLHKHIILKKSSISGTGLFATAPILTGELVWQAIKSWDAHKMTRAQIEALPLAEQERILTHWYQISDNDWVGGDPDDDHSLYMNHSCDPNVWLISDTQMAARRDIVAGEEITYDYSTSETLLFHMQCHCGVVCCRGLLTGSEYQQTAFQDIYRGHVMTYIAQKIDSE